MGVHGMTVSQLGVSLPALALVVMLLVASLHVSTMQASAMSQEYVRLITASTLVPAVSGKSGELINVTLTIAWPGSGVYRIFAGGSVGNSTYYSVESAIWTASLFLGIDPRDYDVNVTFYTPTSISGPSASLAIAALFYAALTPTANLSLIKNRVITGAVIPQGYAGPVGGIGEKCKAALARNLTFIAPLANAQDVPSSCRDWDVELVTSILDVVSAAKTSSSLSVNLSQLAGTYQTTMANVMRQASILMSKEAWSIINETTPFLINGNHSYIDQASDLINQATDLLEEANATLSEKPYSSASYSFTALQRALTAKYLVLIIKGRLGINEEISQIEASLASMQKRISNKEKGVMCMEKLEILSVAASRVSDAFYRLEVVKKLRSSGQLIDPFTLASELAGAKARIESIKSWMDVFNSIKCVSPLPRNISAGIRTVHLYANIIYNYTVSVLREAGGEEFIQPLASLAERANSAYASGDYVLALGYYRDLLSKCTYILFDSLIPPESEDVLKGYFNTSLRIYFIHYALLAVRGVSSQLAPAYLEYALDLAERKDLLSALSVAASAIASEEVEELLLMGSSTAHQSIMQTPPSPPSGSNPLETVTIGLTLALLGFAIGFALAARSFSARILRGLPKL